MKLHPDKNPTDKVRGVAYGWEATRRGRRAGTDPVARPPLRVHSMPTQDATAKFQALQRIYEVLSDAERRKLYDETGCVDGEGGDEDTMRQFYSFFRSQFKEVRR